MGLFNLFSSSSYEKLEKKGDGYFEVKKFGDAKLAYEDALSRLEGKSIPGFLTHKKRIEEKIVKSREALAAKHKSDAEDLIEAGCDEDAAELLELALELTGSSALTAEVERLLQDIQARQAYPENEAIVEFVSEFESDDDNDEDNADHHFTVLCGALPEEEQGAYRSYGESFKQGYVALNRGDFDQAIDFLSRALEEHGSGASYIHLELATAYLNIGDMETAYDLLEQFMNAYPTSVRAYEMLCDILWEKGAHTEALKRLSGCPDEIQASLRIHLLLGDTLLQAKRYNEAETFYLKHMERNGWNEYLARGLAKTYEAVGSEERARHLYARIMSECKGCGATVDPLVKQRYADLSYEAGDLSEKVVELYLSLCREDPENRGRYYRRLSDIYSQQGHHNEAKRYLAFAEKLEEGSK